MANRNMGKPVERKSSIEESDSRLRVMIPQQRRTGAMAWLSLLFIICVSGLCISVTLVITTSISSILGAIFMAAGLYFAIRGLGWQLKGETTLTLEDGVMLLKKKAPFRNTEKAYDLAKIKTFSHHNVTANTPPIAMLQSFGVLNRHKLIFVYGLFTLSIPGSLNVSEIQELSSVLNKYLSRFKMAQG